MSEFVAGLKNGWKESQIPKGLFASSVKIGAFGAAAALILLQFIR